MASVTEYLSKIQELTQQNLDILQALNDSFFTKQNHLVVNVGENKYAIPSFLSLESKINSLTENFNNLVHAPESGEAFFHFDGNSRAIEVKPYTYTPNAIELQPVTEFGVDKNNIFKDFLTPKPFINLDVHTIPNDITNVIVKKVIPIHQDLISFYDSLLTTSTSDSTSIIVPSVKYHYKDLYKTLSIYEKDKDYIEYDTIVKMPIRKSLGNGMYVIKEIVSDIVDENLDNYITLKFRDDLDSTLYMNSLKYRLFDETIEKYLEIGDHLVTHEGNAKMEITEIHVNTNTITVKVLHGEYLNLVASPTGLNISDLSKMRFYSDVNFDNDKYINVPLEEDKYIFVAISPLNDRMNIQSSWGSGLVINTYNLSSVDGKTKFKNYYDNNVKNIGDILMEISSIMSNTLMNNTENDYIEFTSLVPVIYKDDLSVSQINTHINNSTTVQNIRTLYSSKKDLQSQLDEVQGEIDAINNTLSTISFDDTTGVRTAYTDQLKSLQSRKNEISVSITKIINDIAIAANNSEIPIENAKYRIRGFYDFETFLDSIGKSSLKDHVKGIRVQYRYKNVDQEQGNSKSINGKFIFSDWNNMDSFDRQRISSYDDGYKFEIEKYNGNINEPSFNQIDIPITQGETVDIRLKLIYDFGYPFIEISSAWSKIENIAFPDEYLKNIKILDIISENNNDIETNRFNNIIDDTGITKHINDKLIDQDITYHHNPENIASGFYTQERRIIPLKDKLVSLDASITELFDEILGSNSEHISVSISNNENDIDLIPYVVNNMYVASYDNFIGDSSQNEMDDLISSGSYSYNTVTGLVTTILNLTLTNTSNHSVKLYSLFPGSRDTNISDLRNVKYNKSEYCDENDPNLGVYYEYPSIGESEGSSNNLRIQTGNQFITFRIKDVNDATPYYGTGNQSTSNLLSLESDYIKNQQTGVISRTVAYMYPKISNKYGLCIDSDNVGSYILIDGGSSIVIPIIFEYKITGNDSIHKIMSFDIRPSLYKDPITYTFRVIAKSKMTTQDKILITNNKKIRRPYLRAAKMLESIKLNTTVK